VQLLVLAKHGLEEDGCCEADFCRETGIVSSLVELGLDLSADWKELSKFFLTAVEYVGADLTDEEGIVFAFRWSAAVRSRGCKFFM